MAAAVVLATAPAGAHTVGGSCVAALEHCESWSAAVQGPPVAGGTRPDEFPAAVALSATTAYAGAKAVALNLDDPYSSTAS